jgi:hypothetical protein
MLGTIRVNGTLSVDFGELEAGPPQELGPFVLIARKNGGAVSLRPSEIPGLAEALGEALAMLNATTRQDHERKL